MILLKDCFRVVRPRSGAGGAAGSSSEDLAGVDVLIEGKRIKRIAKGIVPPAACEVVDASRHVVMPGLVNGQLQHFLGRWRQVHARDIRSPVGEGQALDDLLYLVGL